MVEKAYERRDEVTSGSGGDTSAGSATGSGDGTRLPQPVPCAALSSNKTERRCCPYGEQHRLKAKETVTTRSKK
jgi:hypothetical protein